MSLTDLRATWTTLYKHTLPSLAINKSPVQDYWPIHLDHCFARIILDAVIGETVPWTSKLVAPAWKNMSVEQLKSAIDLGHQIVRGEANLVELDTRSLELRGKKKHSQGSERKRKRDYDMVGKGENEMLSSNMRSEKKRPRQSDIRATMNVSKSSEESQKQSKLPLTPVTPASIDPELLSLVTSSGLSPFRQRVLLTLCQVPSGRFTTYAAMSGFLHSCPRAVGNALRNNPFAPRVPCHRVVASGGGIGGFGGDWGAQGKYVGEKIRLLKEEAVRVNSKGDRVFGQAWNGFI